MYNKKQYISKIFSMLILFILILSVLGPIGEGSSELEPSETSSDNFNLASDDDWVINQTTYVNSSRTVDSNVIIQGDGKLIINNSTLTLLVDEYHPWEIKIRDGGELNLWNSTITTRPKEDLLRPFIKTNVSVQGGSSILMRQNSQFKFPGWIYVHNSTFTMKDSSFERLSDENIPFEEQLLIDDNNDCPRFTAHDNSNILIENSEINDYYRNDRLNNEEMEWRTFIEEMNEADGSFYQVEPSETLNINEWYLHDPNLPLGNYRYINPYDKISALYIEIQYNTEDNYTASSPLEYNVNGVWKEALSIEHTDLITDEYSDIWEIELNDFYKSDEYFLKDLEVRLENVDDSEENKNISIDKINLVSQYNNDINIRDSNIRIINSHIDVDYQPANTDPREDEFEATDDTTWMEDANLMRSAIRLVNSSFKSYGIFPNDEWDPDGDPFLITDPLSENRTWIYRWLTVTALDSAGTPLPETNLTATLSEDYKDLSGALYDNVIEENKLQNNPEVWEYLNRTGKGYYDIENETFVTDENGQVTLFLISDRINHPQDWPNSRKVGDYWINGTHTDLGNANEDTSLESFPNMNESATFHELELVFFTIPSKPQIIIDYFELEPSETYDGEQIELEGQITNTGDSTSSDILVTFYLDKDTENEEIIYSTFISGLNSEESYIVQYDWTTQMITDNLTEDRNISMIVETEEMDEIIDHSVNETITIMKPAEIDLTEDDISFSTDLSQIGETLEINANVRNTGGASAPTNLYFYEGDPTDTNLIDEIHIEIGPESEENGTIEWTPMNRGNREIYVIAEYDEDIVQTMVTKPIFSSDYQYDLIVNDTNSPLEISGTYGLNGFAVIEEGGVLTIKGGTTRARFEMMMNQNNRFSIIIRDQGELILDSAILYSDYNFDILVEDQGSFTVIDNSRVYSMARLIADSNTELNFINSSFEGMIEVYSQKFEALESKFTSSNIFLQPSDIECVNVTFEGDLVNFKDTHGNLTAVQTNEIQMTGDSEINLYRWLEVRTMSYGDLPISGVKVQAINSIYEEEVTTKEGGIACLRLLTDVMTPGTSDFVGNYEISARYEEATQTYNVDPFTKKLPSYPSQEHIISEDIYFEDLFIPDLDITNDRITISPDEITSGEETTIEAHIYNIGQTTAEEIEVLFYLDDNLIDTDVVSEIDKDGTAIASINWVASMRDEDQIYETREIRAFINPEMLPIKDPNIENNEASIDFRVYSPPRLEFGTDLRIFKDGEILENRTIIERDTLNLNIELENRGGTPLKNASIQFLYGSTPLSENITDIDRDSSLSISEEWLVDVSGEQTLKVWFNSSTEEPDHSISLTKTIDIQPMDLIFTDIETPTTEQPTQEIIPIRGILLREDNDMPIDDIVVTAYLVDEEGNIIRESDARTGDDGSFLIQISTPEKAGNYGVALQAEHHETELYETGHSVSVVGAVEEGIPLWMIIVVIAAIAAGSILLIFFFIMTKGAGEWVECGNCGATIPTDSKECPKCGVEFEMETVKCSECGEWIPADSNICPECGAEFITTGEDIIDYEERMKEQYDEFVEEQKKKAEEELGIELDDEEFTNWWENQPSYITFDEWLEREEARRKEGGIECPECGALNSVDDAICQKCGTTLIQLDTEELDIEEDLDELEELEEMEDVFTEEERIETEKEIEETVDEESKEKSTEEKPKKMVKKKVRRKPKKVVKKKVKKESEERE